MLVSVLSLASALCSQSPGSTNTCYSVGTQPHSVATGNFDGANGNDVVVSNEAANTVQLLLNNGSGVLQAQAAITVGTAPRGLTAADFDGDGNLDVAVACAGSAAVYMLWGNGSGGFAAPQVVASNVGVPVTVAAITLPGQARPDLIVCNGGSFFTPGSILLCGNGANATPLTRSFAAPSALLTGGFYADLAVGDVLGTSAPEIVATNTAAGPTLGVHVIDAATLSPVAGSPFAAGRTPESIALGDLNGDGKSDIIVTSISPLPGPAGASVLQTPSLTPTVIATVPAVAAAIGNIDGDSKTSSAESVSIFTLIPR